MPVGPQPGQVGNPAYAPYALAVDALAGFLKSKIAADIIKSYGYDL